VSGGDTRSARIRSAIDGPWLVLSIGAALALLVAWRSTLGMSFMDDGYYVAATIRLAQGARLFVDEVFVQSSGFLAAVPFAKLWIWLFGMNGIAAALRVFYVVLATCAAAFTYRLLRPSFGRWACLAGSIVVFMAPVYNILAVTYDTMAALGMVLACVLTFAAVRDSRRGYAVVAGAFAAFAAVSYPPLSLMGIALLITLGVRTRDRALCGAMALGALVVAGTFVGWLLATTSLAELTSSVQFIVASWARPSGTEHGTRIVIGLQVLAADLGRRWLIPIWAWFGPAAALSLGAAFLHRHDAGPVDASARRRGVLLLSVPAALTLEVIAYKFAFHESVGRAASGLGTVGGNFLIAFVFFSVVPMGLSLRHARPAVRDLARLLVPVGLVGYLVTVLSSSASIADASGIVGLAPVVIAVVVWWCCEIADVLGRPAEAGAAAAMLAILLVLLFGSTLYDGTPALLRATIPQGAYAGITTNPHQAARVADLRRLSGRWVGPRTTVTVVGLPGVYPAIGGVPLTNVVWLDPGPWDSFTVAYLNDKGRWPDVVFAPLMFARASAAKLAKDPFMAEVVAHYALVERSSVSGVAVYKARRAVGS
jgi:hypothetical protein